MKRLLSLVALCALVGLAFGCGGGGLGGIIYDDGGGGLPQNPLIDIDAAGGLVYGTDSGNLRRFSPGAPASTIFASVPGGRQLVADPNGTAVYVAEFDEFSSPSVSRIEKFDGNLTSVARTTTISFDFSTTVALAGAGSGSSMAIYALDRNGGAHRLRRLNAALNQSVDIPLGVTLTNPVNIAVDGSGRIYIADDAPGAPRILRLTSAGALDSTFSASGFPENDPLGSASDIAVDARGNVFVVDRAMSKIRLLDGSGRYLTSDFRTVAALQQPSRVAVDTSGTVYVLDPVPFTGQPGTTSSLYVLQRRP